MALNSERTIVPRGRIWKKNRIFVLNRDGRKCYRCGKENLSGRDAHVDHIKPVALGGEDELWNYAACCALCNKKKSDRFEPVDEAFYNQRKAEASSGRNTTAVSRIPSLKVNHDGSPNQRIGLAEIEKMFAAYQVRQSAKYIVETCGVGSGTAKRYIEVGDPSRNVEPFAERLARIQAARREKVDAQSIEAGADIAGSILKLFKAAIAGLVETDEDGNIKSLKVTPDFRDVVELGRFYQVLVGGADSRTEHVHKFADMTDDELRAFIAQKKKALGAAGVVLDAEIVESRPALPAPAPEPPTTFDEGDF